MVMYNNYPLIVQEDEKISIEFEPIKEVHKIITVDVIMDINLFKEIVGVEIVNLKFQLGSDVFSKLKINLKSQNGISIAYDDDSDALYMCLKNDRSSDQVSACGQLLINQEERLAGLVLKLDPRNNK